MSLSVTSAGIPRRLLAEKSRQIRLPKNQSHVANEAAPPRANSRLKEDFGASNVMVKGHSKVTLHLMLGVVVLFADQLLRLAG
jgi:hypothetical protein